MKIQIIEISKKDNIIISVPSHYPSKIKEKRQNVFKEMKQCIDYGENGMVFMVNEDVEITILKTK